MQSTRKLWLSALDRMVTPVLTRLSEMPLVQHLGAGREASGSHEALSRVLVGISPWLSIPSSSDPEDKLKRSVFDNAVASLNTIFLDTNISVPQSVVDCGYFCQAFLQAPSLWSSLDTKAQKHFLNYALDTRRHKPVSNNWLFMASLTEAFLFQIGDAVDFMRVDHAIRSAENWYKGDGIYGDGEFLQNDYYNSIVTHPALYWIETVFKGTDREWDALFAGKARPSWRVRSTRYASVLERLISPEGTYPVVGRSALYKMGCFHGLSHALAYGYYQGDPAGAQSALTAVLTKQLPTCLDENGWLRMAFAHHENLDLAETYVSTGSLYAFCLAFSLLGATDPGVWEYSPWTQKRLWDGLSVERDFGIDYK